MIGTQQADVIVIGKNAKLVPESNEEVRAAMAASVVIELFGLGFGIFAITEEKSNAIQLHRQETNPTELRPRQQPSLG